MTERPESPDPLPSGLDDLLAEFRDGDVLPQPARERIWKTVGADEPPKRRFVPPPAATGHSGRRWALVAAAAVTVLWLGFGDRLTADEAQHDARRDAAAMVEYEDATPRTAIDRQPTTKVRAGTPEPRPEPPPVPVPLEPNAAAEADAAASVPEPVGPTRADKLRPRPNRTEPDREPQPKPASTLAEEQRLVSKAWSAITEGDPEGAMASVRAHAKRYPSGMLAPERDAVSAIARCRISPDASASILAAFRRAHASSPLASRVSKACTGGEIKYPAP